MAFDLPPTGEASYRGFVFSSAMLTTGFRCEPEYTSDGRTIKHWKYTVSISDVLSNSAAAGISTDARMDELANALMESGGAFEYSDKGFGEFSINTGGEQRDLEWGPKPKSLSLSHIGDKFVQRFEWTVEFALVKCANARYEGVKEFAYAVTYDIDVSGLTVRTINGHIVIAHTREDENDRRAHKTADDYRDKIFSVPPNGFQQTSRFTLSEDRSRLDFTITQTEMGGNPLPPGIVKADVGEYINSDKAFTTWNVTIRGEYEIAKGFNAVNATKHFIDLLDTRKAAFKNVAGKGFTLIPVTWSASEPSIFGRKKIATMAMGFNVIGTVRTFLHEGLWEPVAGDWNVWKRSMSNSGMNARGFAGLEFDPTDDIIVDLCIPDNKANLKGMAKRPQRIDNAVNDATRDAIGSFVSRALSGSVTEERSWIDYQLQYRIEPQNNVAIASPLPILKNNVQPRAAQADPDVIALGDRSLSASGMDFVQQPLNRIINEQNAEPDIIQELSPTTYFIVLSGSAMRIGFPIGAPSIEEAMGGIAIPFNDPASGDGFSQAQVSNLGLPIYAAEWQLRYVVAGPTRGADAGMLENPLYGNAVSLGIPPLGRSSSTTILSGAR